mmetsp:Transcript_39719/g.118194  ORF Transcript_39719/g.118194 Transcript_39719/m.118194 type:complete len:282 (+) Transcript_39719:100-945(+)
MATMFKQALPLALRFLQGGKDQGCSKLLGNAMLFSTRNGVVASSEAQVLAAADGKVAQYSASEAAAMAAKQKHINGLGGLALQPTRAMSFASSKSYSSAAAAAAPAATEAVKESSSFFGRMAKAVAALAAAVAMALAPPAAADAPQPWQWGFQDTGTSQAQAQVDLHHDIMFVVISITTLVLYMTFMFATKFHYSVSPIAEKLTHHTTLEVIWTVIPTIIVLFIGIPSLTLIYSMDQVLDKPGLTVKVIGRQWYWSYEMHDHLQHKLVDPDRLVALAEKTI